MLNKVTKCSFNHLLGTQYLASSIWKYLHTICNFQVRTPQDSIYPWSCSHIATKYRCNQLTSAYFAQPTRHLQQRNTNHEHTYLLEYAQGNIASRTTRDAHALSIIAYISNNEYEPTKSRVPPPGGSPRNQAWREVVGGPVSVRFPWPAA